MVETSDLVQHVDDLHTPSSVTDEAVLAKTYCSLIVKDDGRLAAFSIRAHWSQAQHNLESCIMQVMHFGEGDTDQNSGRKVAAEPSRN